ncbi:MAG: dihydropteroate synthase [Thermoleophilia bacterium]|nr:dihydropteroate synthase [Thermoleophilia bacterium]
MLIVGEKINGTLRPVAEAIESRNAKLVQELALRQAEAGADFIDLNAGTGPQEEPESLVWLIESVEKVTDVPLCLDSAESAAILAGLEAVARPALVNSISGKEHLLNEVLPMLSGRCWGVIALLLDDQGIPGSVEERLAIGRRLIARTRAAGIDDERVFVDPLAVAVSTRQDGALLALETMTKLRDEFPSIKFGLGLSNVSFGLPARKVLNRVFLTLAVAAGLDMAILDPLDDGLYSELRAAELLLGRDRFCRTYTKAFRTGRIG